MEERSCQQQQCFMRTVNCRNEKMPLIESIKIPSRGKTVLDLAHCLGGKKKTIHSYKITAVTSLIGNNFNFQVKHNSVISIMKITVDKIINIKHIWKW